jgi:hypothetical protein
MWREYHVEIVAVVEDLHKNVHGRGDHPEHGISHFESDTKIIDNGMEFYVPVLQQRAI